MLFPAANDLLTMFVALEVLSLPLYLLCGLARRRRLLSQEAALKYFMLGAFSSGFFLYGIALVYGYAGSMSFADIAEAVSGRIGGAGAAARRHRPDRGRPAVQGRRRAVPRLDARTSTRAPRPRSPRSWRPAPRSPRSVRCCGCSTSPSARARWDWQPMIVDRRGPDHAGRLRSSRSPRPTSSGCWPTPRSRTPASCSSASSALHTVSPARRRRDLLAAGGAVLPGRPTAS